MIEILTVMDKLFIKKPILFKTKLGNKLMIMESPNIINVVIVMPKYIFILYRKNFNLIKIKISLDGGYYQKVLDKFNLKFNGFHKQGSEIKEKSDIDMLLIESRWNK